METPKSGRLLVVEDDRELMTSLCEAMANHGYETMGVTSAKDAVEALKEQNFDLLLTDLVMPEMDGIALLREGLNVDPHLVGIIMTEQGTVETAVDAMKVGAFDYVLKPLNLRELMKLLSRAMEVRHLRLGDVRLRQGVAVQGLFEAISYLHDATAILNKAADAALEQCEADEASIMVPMPDGNELCVVVARGEGRWNLLGERVPIDKGVAGWVARHHEPLTLHGEVKEAGAAVPVKPRADIRSAISMPMLVGGKLVGVLNVNATHRRRPFTLGQVKALNILASIAAAGSEGAQLYTRAREAEAKFRSIFNNSVEGVFQMSPVGRYIIANPSLARILGYGSPEALTAEVTDIRSQIYADPARHDEFLRLLKERHMVEKFEFQAYRKDGGVTWLSQSARIVQDQHGALQCYEGSVEEITARKRSEARQAAQLAVSHILAESPSLSASAPQLLQALCETLQWKLGAIWFVDREAKVLRCESIWYRPSAKVEEFVATSRKMTFPSGRGLPGRVWANGEAAWIPDVVRDPNFPRAPVAAREGLHAAVGFPIGSGGRISGVLEFFSTEILEPDTDLLQMMSDVGIKIGQFLERKRAEEDLQAKTTQLETITGALTAFLESRDWQDASTRLLSAALNQTRSEYGFIGVLVDGPALRILAHQGIVWDDMANREFSAKAIRASKQFGFLELTDMDNVFGKVITSGQILLVNDPATDPRSAGPLLGQPPLRHFLGVPFHRGAQLVGMIAVVNNPDGYTGIELGKIQILTQAAGVLCDSYRRQQREGALEKQLRQSEKMASLGTLLGGLAHELNNPLFAISGYAQILIEQVGRGEYEGLAHDLSAVRDASKRATAIVERFLGQARPASGARERCEVNAVVKRALDLVANDFSINQIRIETDLRPHLPPILADSQGLSEVLLNLFTNARHAMGQAHGAGTLTVATSCRTMGTSLGQAEIRVSDDGPGIPPEQLGQIFDPFYTTKAVGEGTGLGLFICHQIITELGGTLTCESQPGSGATFFVRLPVLREDGPGGSREAEKGGARGDDSAGRR